MAISEQQRIERRHWIGSSDAAALLGVSKWKTPMELWLEKRGAVAEVEPNLDMQIGTALEPVVIACAVKDLGAIERDVWLPKPEFRIASNLDGRVIATGEPVEAKTSGTPDGWGEEGTDAVPDDYVVQAHVHMICTERKVCWVPCLVERRTYRLYRVDYTDSLANAVIDAAAEFWRHVESNTPPDDIRVSREIARRVNRELGEVIEIPDSAFAAVLAAKEDLKFAQATAEAAESVLFGYLGQAEAGRCSLGDVTFKTQKRKGYTVQDSEFRVLRLKPRKEN